MPPDKQAEFGDIIIELPDARIDKRNIWCEVLKVGNGYYADGSYHKPDVKEGDIVAISPWAGDKITFEIVDGCEIHHVEGAMIDGLASSEPMDA